jgi:hypothetical protein
LASRRRCGGAPARVVLVVTVADHDLALPTIQPLIAWRGPTIAVPSSIMPIWARPGAAWPPWSSVSGDCVYGRLGEHRRPGRPAAIEKPHHGLHRPRIGAPASIKFRTACRNVDGEHDVDASVEIWGGLR